MGGGWMIQATHLGVADSPVQILTSPDNPVLRPRASKNPTAIVLDMSNLKQRKCQGRLESSLHSN